MIAFVLIRVSHKASRAVLEHLRNHCKDYLEEAHVLFGGERDVIAKIVVRDASELDEVLFNRIQAHPNVDSTITYIVSDGQSR